MKPLLLLVQTCMSKLCLRFKNPRRFIAGSVNYDYSVKDQLIQLGTGRGGAPILTLRLIEIKVGKSVHSYITSVLDPNVLPPYVVADLYRRRWRIEDAFHTVKRLLGLSYLWTGSIK
jgi:IS4 transposase